jgi:uncharacterized membrane protein (UPF0182 family)
MLDNAPNSMLVTIDQTPTCLLADSDRGGPTSKAAPCQQEICGRAEGSTMNATAVESIKTQSNESGNKTGRVLPPAIGSLLRWGIWGLLALGIIVTVMLGLVQKWLWMKDLNYLGIFWTLLSAKWGMFAVAFIVSIVYLWLNLRSAATNVDHARGSITLGRSPADPSGSSRRIAVDLSPKLLVYAIGAAIVFVSLLFALSVSSQWDTFLRFRYGSSFGVADPLFGVDLGFYVFRLPFYELVQGSITLLTFAALLILSCCVVFSFRQTSSGPKLILANDTSRHFIVLLFILAANFGWGFYLDHYQLVYSTLGVVHGAGYAAAHVTLPALWMMLAASVLSCILLGVGYFNPNEKRVAAGIGVYALLYVVGVIAAPYLFQAFIVQPSELSLESPYLVNYISSTRKAYKLDNIQETAYPALTDLTPDVIARNQDTIQNIRLWDSRPLLQTYNQTQAIRLYYNFYNVDVDRYRLADGYHQVMLASRELASQLPSDAQTWVNENLEFTHGNGLVMNFVSTTTGGGLPQYLLENIPAESQYGLTITQPAIYYGEVAPGYKMVSTGIKEFDYPKGNENVYTSYAGTGGIPIDSFWKRLLFAWTQKDINILLTSYLRPESKIQIWRGVQDRITQVAPFLLLDKDPYAVLSDGKLYWIQDAYTGTDHYPYSNPQTTGTAQGMNYIRNSVKAVVDMYDGTVTFYIMDQKDPVLGMYEKAFPGTFKNLSELSPDLKAHLRYPEDLFAIQAAEYASFHMTDPQVFYNREDLWVPPLEKYDGAVNPMDPYYMLMKLPGSDQLEYLIMTPFTPQKRDNMIAWLAARCDFPDYGRMLFYELPKDKLTFGPNQISAMIDQSTTISQQLTLWDQKGSGVIRGKLIVIPIENSFLYVVPLYLKAEGTNFPQLKRVIAATGDKVVMEPTLDEALTSLFETATPPLGVTQSQQAGGATQLPKPTRDQVMAQLQDAQKAIDALKRLLASPPQ